MDHRAETDRPAAFDTFEGVTACDLCGGMDFEVVDIPAGIQACRACGFRFLSPRPTQDEIRRSYSQPGQYDPWLNQAAGREQMWMDRLKVLERFRSSGTLLDVGAGIGTFLAMARDSGRWTVLGTEVSASARAHASAQYGLELMDAQLEDVAGLDGRVDAVTFWHALEHVPSPTVAARAAARLLTPGGVLLVAVPNDSRERHLQARLRRNLPVLRAGPIYEPAVYGGEIHLSHFSQGSLAHLLGSVGLDVVLRTIDDHYPVRRPSNRVRFLTARAICRGLKLNVGQTILMVARKPSDSREPNSRSGKI